jgi:hypothetical protein
MSNKIIEKLIEFEAEIQAEGVKKLVTLDREYKIILTTDNIKAHDLGRVPADCTVKVSIKAPIEVENE